MHSIRRFILRFATPTIMLGLLGTMPCVVASQDVQIIRRANSYEDGDLKMLGLGRLEVVLRSSEQPTQWLAQGTVSVQRLPADSLRRLATNQSGIAYFDSLAIGSYEVIAQRIGYGRVVIQVDILGGCRTAVEAYVSIQAIGIAPPPPMPGRATITTCPIRP